MKDKNLISKILLNYSILLVCVVGFSTGIYVLILPIIQICISIFNYNNSKKWQTLLMLEVHLWISTVLGLFLGKYLFLKYISNDEASVFILEGIVRIGAIWVFIMGIITTLSKYISIKLNARNQKINQSKNEHT